MQGNELEIFMADWVLLITVICALALGACQLIDR